MPSTSGRDPGTATLARWERAAAAVRRACAAGLTPDALGEVVGARVAEVLDAPAWSFCRTDPATGLLTHARNEGIGDRMQQAYVTSFYPEVEAIRYLDMARSGEATSTDVPPGEASEAFGEVMTDAGLGAGIRVALTAGAAQAGGPTLWGTLSLLRPTDAHRFGPAEQHFLGEIAPHIARALRRATLTPPSLTAAESAGTTASGSSSVDADRVAPAVLTLDGAGRMIFQTANAAPMLGDLADHERTRGIGMRGTTATATLPGVIGGVLAQLRWRRAHSPHASLGSTLMVNGASGRRYALHAVHTEEYSAGAVRTVVTITPAHATNGSAALAMRYGLSAREHAVLLRVARGESTKAIAAALKLSVYTVQDHVGRACERVGVTTRRELVARLFLDALEG